MKRKEKTKAKIIERKSPFETRKIETSGITLIALVITTIFSYDEKLKCSNYNGFLLETI